MQSLLLSKGLSIPSRNKPWEPVEQFRYAKKAIDIDMTVLTQETLTEGKITCGYVLGDLNLPFDRKKLFDDEMK